MARHDQRPDKKHMTCPACHKGECENCVDVSRILAGYQKTICQCTRKNHEGEPAAQQILDPESGTVYAPGLEVSIDGEVKFKHDRCPQCGFRHGMEGCAV